jgi:hypothetical protein
MLLRSMQQAIYIADEWRSIWPVFSTRLTPFHQPDPPSQPPLFAT